MATAVMTPQTPMTPLVQPYSTSMFNTIEGFFTAKDRLGAHGGTAFITRVFRPLIEAHGLESQLGVGLLHRHFRLDATEKLVEFNNISTPWAGQAADDSHTGGAIVPLAWAVRGEYLIPYEFFFSPLGAAKPFDFGTQKAAAFVKEFTAAVREYGLENVVGLRLFPHAGFTGGLEFTEGRANINLATEQLTDKELADSVETMWFFDPEYLEKEFACKCSNPKGDCSYGW